MGVARLKEKCFATGFMFDAHARLFEHVLDKEGVDHKFVYNKGNTRTNYKIIDKRSMLTEINDKGEIVEREKQKELLSLLSNLSTNASVVVISGSLPEGISNDYYGELVKSVNKKAKVIVDTEGEKLLSVIESGVYLVKPNLVELENTVGKKLNNVKDYLEGCNYLIDKGAKNVLLSLGREGAILTNKKESYFCKSASVAVNSTVGAGDSMVAAVSVMTEKGADYQEILRSAVAAGTASITTPGTNLFYRDKYEEIYSKIYTVKL
jgi:1-phosphofructokinase